MSLEKIDLTPSPHLVESQRNQGMSWWKALAELIDNAFDAQANRVEIITKGKTITVRDNGGGMQDVRNCLRAGSHNATHGRGLGMYGVGLKDAWYFAGNKMEIVTVFNGTRTTLKVDLSELSGGSWQVDADVNEEPAGTPPGTSITIHLRAGRNAPSTEAWDKLAWVFSPGLRRGLQIVKVKGNDQKPLTARPLPRLSESIEDAFDIDGKRVELRVGILAPGEKMAEGPFCFGYLHRIIESSSLGAKGLSTFNIAGTITLGDGWKFNKNKDALADAQDELEDAIFARIEPLLRKAELQSLDAETSALLQQLDTVVAEALQKTRREKRNRTGDAEGTVEPKATGRKRTHASKTTDNPGSVIDGDHGAKRGAKIDFYNGDREIGRYDFRGRRIGLNISHRLIQTLRSEKNMIGLASAAMAILADYTTTTEGDQKLLAVDAENFIKAYSALTETLNV